MLYQICRYLSRKGEFQKVIEVCTRGLIDTAQDQPTARTGYFCYLSALAKDALIHRSGDFEEKRVIDAYTDYRTAYKLLKSTPGYIENILNRTEILSAKSGIPFIIENSFC